MAYLWTARAVTGSYVGRGLDPGYVPTKGSFTSTRHADGEQDFGRPEEILWKGPVRPIPDVVNMPYLCVSGRVRDLIEGFEPGVHSFYPVQLHWDDGSPAASRFLLKVRVELDAVSEKHSTWEPRWRPSYRLDDRLVFDRRRIGNAHLWSTPTLLTGTRYWASDALAEAAIAAGLTGLLLDRVEETDAEGGYEPPPPDRSQVYCLISRNLYGTNYREEPMDGDVARIRPLGGTAPSVPVPQNCPVASWGVALDPAYVPTRIRYGTSRRLPADLSTPGIFTTVSDRLRAVIERVEPDTHQFLPVAYVGRRGELVERRWILVVGRALDAGSREHSSCLREGFYWHNPGKEHGILVMDRAAVGDAHMWVDPATKDWRPFVSRTLAEAIDAENFPGILFRPYRLR